MRTKKKLKNCDKQKRKRIRRLTDDYLMD